MKLKQGIGKPKEIKEKILNIKFDEQNIISLQHKILRFGGLMGMISCLGLMIFPLLPSKLSWIFIFPIICVFIGFFSFIVGFVIIPIFIWFYKSKPNGS